MNLKKATRRLCQRMMNPYPKSDIRYVPTIEESIDNNKNVKLEDAKKFYTDFYGASAATLLGNCMSGGFLSSRLAVRIRQKEGISYGVGSNVSGSPFYKSGSFMTYAIYAPENAKKLEKAFYEKSKKWSTKVSRPTN
ncbi:MAG: insulinase family protein [Emticicia sp.]